MKEMTTSQQAFFSNMRKSEFTPSQAADPFALDNQETFKQHKIDNTLNGQIMQYLDQHAVSSSITSSYTMSATTLNKDKNLMVVFLSKITPAGARISYENYAADLESFNPNKIKLSDRDTHLSYFKLLKRKDASSNLIPINKREFSSRYAQKRPTLSESQQRCFLFDSTQAQPQIDVFDCSDLSFFTDRGQGRLDPRDGSYMCTMRLDPDFTEHFERVVSSENSDTIIGVFGARMIQIFDISDAGRQRKDDFSLKTFKLDNPTYDSILDFDLNDGDYLESWVTLLSKEFGFVETIMLGELI